MKLSLLPMRTKAGSNRQRKSPIVANRAAAIVLVGLFMFVATFYRGGRDPGEPLLERNAGADRSAPGPVAPSLTGKGAAGGSEIANGAMADASAASGGPGFPGDPDDRRDTPIADGSGEPNVDSKPTTGQNVPGNHPTIDDGTTAEELANRLAAEILALPADADIDPDAFDEVGRSGAIEAIVADPAIDTDPTVPPP